MNKALIPHVGNRYSDDAGWVVEVINADYEGLQDVIQTVTVGQVDPYKQSVGLFLSLFEDRPDNTILVKFEKLRQAGIQIIHR